MRIRLIEDSWGRDENGREEDILSKCRQEQYRVSTAHSEKRMVEVVSETEITRGKLNNAFFLLPRFFLEAGSLMANKAYCFEEFLFVSCDLI